MAVTRLPIARWPNTKGPIDSNPYPPTDFVQQNSVMQETLAGSESIIPIVYGKAQLGGRIAIATIYQGKLVLCSVWCMGEVNSITVKINDAAPPAGVTVTSYRGTPSQGVDPILAAAISGFSDRMVYTDPKWGSVGIAYSVVTIPAGLETINGYPSLTAEIQGRKVYDSVAQAKIYTTCPAAALADLITDPILGMRRTVDPASQLAVTLANNELVGGKPRRSINLALTDPQPIAQWLEVLRGYAGCMLSFEGDRVVMVPNRPTTTYVPVTASSIQKGSLSVQRNPSVPNVVRVDYTDATADPWRTNSATVVSAAVSSGQESWLEETVSMPGILDYAQAYREAEERLRAYQYANMDLVFVLLDEGLRFSVGTVIELTHPIGFSNSKFRVEAISSLSSGLWSITASPYNAAIYSNSAPTTPPFPNVKPTNSTDPGIVNPPSGSLTLTETVSFLTDGTPISKISASWTATTHINFKDYEIQWKANTATGWNTDHSVTNSWMSPQVTIGLTYTVQVRNTATDGAVGAWLTGTILIRGKTSFSGYSPPAPLGSSGTLFLKFTWEFDTTINDVAYTEVWMSTTNNFAGATLIAKVAYPGKEYTVHGIPASTCRYFWVRYVDTSGNVTGTYPAGATSGVQLCTPSASAEAAMLSYLTGKIQESHLNTTLSTKIDRASSDANQALIEVGQVANEVYGEYYVKIDVNGRVVGFGLYNSAAEGSLFLVKADRFAVGAPGASSSYPFIVDNGQVYMTSAYIQDLSVQNAKIANLTLGTGKINYNQISSLHGFYNPAELTYGSVQVTRTAGSVSVPGADVYGLLILFQFSFSPGWAGTFVATDPQYYVTDPGPGFTATISLSGGASGSYSLTLDIVPPGKSIHMIGWAPTITPSSTRGNIVVTCSITARGTGDSPADRWARSREHGAAVTVFRR